MSSPENDLGAVENNVSDGEAPRRLSSKDWLARGREHGPGEPSSALRPVPPSRRFTWGWRAGIVVAAVFYGVLVVWSCLDTAHSWSTLLTVLIGVAVITAIVGLVEAWCWAGRARLSTSPLEPITAGLELEATKTVKRMARGCGPDVPDLRTRAALYAWAQHQSTGPMPAYVALGAVTTLAQSGGSTVGLALGVVVLLLTVGGLGWALWLGHRARVLAVHLPTSPTSPAGSHVPGESR